jgi:hypothetical protein
MKNLNLNLVIFFLFVSKLIFSQTNEMLPFKIIKYGPDTCYARGIQIYKNKIFTSNSNGMVYSYDLKSNKIQEEIDRNFSKKLSELRDIHIINENEFVAMQSHEQSGIYRKNGAKINSWIPDSTFFDALDFNSDGVGILMGDPKNDYLQVYLTFNFGKAWMQIKKKEFKTSQGEAGFAASGTVVQVLNDSTYYIATGGLNSRIIKTTNFGKSWESFLVPFQKNESAGIFSMLFWNENEGICVGGNYSKPNDSISTCFVTSNGGKTWNEPKKSLSGYRSCVIKVEKQLYACGTNGIDVSNDYGITWNKISNINSCALAYSKKKLYATTIKGSVAVFKIKRK